MENITKRPGTKKRITYDDAFAVNGKTPPQAIELEEAVLGALMLDQNALTNTIEIIKPEYFYKPEHEIIFKAIVSLFEKTQPVDILTVVETLRSTGKLEAAGGAYYVSQLTSRVASAAHIEYHARILSQKYIYERNTCVAAIWSYAFFVRSFGCALFYLSMERGERREKNI